MASVVGVAAALLVVAVGARSSGHRTTSRTDMRGVAASGAAIGRSAVRRVGATGRGHARPDPLPDIVRLRSSVAAGASAWQACSEVVAAGGAWAGGLAPVTAAGPGRVPLARSLDAWAARTGDPAASLVADAVVLAGETGGSLVAALDAVADTVRARAAVEREVRALASSARASSGVLVATPLAFAVAVAILDGRVRAFLGTPAGLACLLGGAVLDLLGGWWMRRQIAAVA